MFGKIDIDDEATAFLDAMFRYSIAQNKRLIKSGDPDAAQDHFTMMTLHAKLRSVPHNGTSWQNYSENILNTAEAYQLHLKTGGYYGAPIIGSAIKEIQGSLREHAPNDQNSSRDAAYVSLNSVNYP